MMSNAAKMRSAVSITVVTVGTWRPELQQAIAVRRAVTVETPESAVGRGAADPGRTQSAHDGAVDRLALVPGRLGGADRELLPEREAMVVRFRPPVPGR